MIVRAAILAATATLLAAPTPGRVEVVSVRGVIDATIQRSVTTTLRDAARERAAAVVIEIDSRGSLGAGPVNAIVDAIGRSDVRVVTWVAPPGARAEHGAAVIAQAGHVRAMAPGAAVGPVRTLDLRTSLDPQDALARAARAGRRDPAPITRSHTAVHAEERGLVDVLALQLPDLLQELDIDASSVRFRKADLIGRALHAVTQPSMAYLLLLLGLVGLVFEAFHPSTGPAGLTGALSAALGIYGVVVMGGSWIGLALLAAAAVAMSVDLRFAALGVFTLAGVVCLVAGSLLLFTAPLLRIDPGVLAFGILGMLAFMLGAMTRVLRDLRAIARGEMEQVDPVEELHRRDGP